MTKSPTRESLPQPSEQPQPRRRNAYDYDGEYEFPTVQHWTAPLAYPSVWRAAGPVLGHTLRYVATMAALHLKAGVGPVNLIFEYTS